MVTICATCFMSEHCNLPTECIYVSSGLFIPVTAPRALTYSLSSVHQLCQTSAGNRQTVQCSVCKQNQELALHTSGFEHTKCIWCMYNIRTLFYLTIHIITFNQTVSCNGKQWSAHHYSYLPWARVHMFSSNTMLLIWRFYSPYCYRTY
jgi:hypothetical protein